MKKMKNKHGFTLAELLIVVAIIAVLVAISIPIFTNQLEKSREAVDAANIRAAYAEVVAAGITGETSGTSKTITLKQEKSSWQNAFDFPSNLISKSSGPKAKQSGVTIKYTSSGNSGKGGATINIKLTPSSSSQ